MGIQIIKPKDQASGQFDGGNIKEQKPIGFSGEGSIITRLGPLFYWAWAHSQGPAEIGFHPHQGFEIITYVINGKGYHRDTLGRKVLYKREEPSSCKQALVCNMLRRLWSRLKAFKFGLNHI